MILSFLMQDYWCWKLSARKTKNNNGRRRLTITVSLAISDDIAMIRLARSSKHFTLLSVLQIVGGANHALDSGQCKWASCLYGLFADDIRKILLSSSLRSLTYRLAEPKFG